MTCGTPPEDKHAAVRTRTFYCPVLPLLQRNSPFPPAGCPPQVGVVGLGSLAEARQLERDAVRLPVWLSLCRQRRVFGGRAGGRHTASPPERKQRQEQVPHGDLMAVRGHQQDLESTVGELDQPAAATRQRRYCASVHNRCSDRKSITAPSDVKRRNSPDSPQPSCHTYHDGLRPAARAHVQIHHTRRLPKGFRDPVRHRVALTPATCRHTMGKCPTRSRRPPSLGRRPF